MQREQGLQQVLVALCARCCDLPPTYMCRGRGSSTLGSALPCPATPPPAVNAPAPPLLLPACLRTSPVPCTACAHRCSATGVCLVPASGGQLLGGVGNHGALHPAAARSKRSSRKRRARVCVCVCVSTRAGTQRLYMILLSSRTRLHLPELLAIQMMLI